MCVTCGCGSHEHNASPAAHHTHGHGHHHNHSHDHQHEHEHHVQDRMITLEKDILYENNLLAQRNRGFLDAKQIMALNLVSSPGSGKTMLLERTINDLKNEIPLFVIEGDQQTNRDAERILKTGAQAVQINTGKGCHLDAHMVLHAIQDLKPEENSILFIENVGNLVCPAMFDLGENHRVVIMSVTEGDDKPIKYPDMFHSSNLCVISKCDLLPYVQFDIEAAKKYASQINPNLEFIQLSCTSGEGMEDWYNWLKQKRKQQEPA